MEKHGREVGNYPKARIAARTGFMNSKWDGGDIAFRPETWAALAALLHPDAFVFAFAGMRGYQRMACAMEDAGAHYSPGDWLGIRRRISKSNASQRPTLLPASAPSTLLHSVVRRTLRSCRYHACEFCGELIAVARTFELSRREGCRNSIYALYDNCRRWPLSTLPGICA